MLSCHDVAQLLTEAREHKLPLMTRLGMRFHLLLCGLCRRFEKQMHRLEQLISLESLLHQAPGLPPEARKKMKKALHD